MGSKIVVAGVTSLYMAVPVEGFPVISEPARILPGLRSGTAGTGIHVAEALAALGDRVSLCTVVGDDLAGTAITTELERHGLLGPGVISGPESSLGVVFVARDGQRIGYPYLAAVNAVEYPAEVFRRQALDADLAVLTNARFVRPLLEHAEHLRVPVAVDVHVITDVDDPYNRPWLEVADVVFCSHERLPCTSAEWVARIFDRYPGCTVAGVGLGARGCALGLRDGRLVEVEALAPRGVVNTSGAGDALFASFLHGWLATGNPVEALRQAVLYAGWTVGDPGPGATPLTEEELARLRFAHPVRSRVGRWDGG